MTGHSTIIAGFAFTERSEPSSYYANTGMTLVEIEAMAYVQADALIASNIYHKRRAAQQLLLDAGDLESLMVERLKKRGATVADCGDLQARLESRPSYEYDIEVLAQLQAWLDVDVYEAAVQRVVSVKVNKTRLNQLEKMGGDIAEAIRAATTTTQGAPRLVLREKAVRGG